MTPLLILDGDITARREGKEGRVRALWKTEIVGWFLPEHGG